jgi:ribose transport system ATP-binding protein
MPDVLLVEGLSKRYGATTALASATFSCRAGEVHALIGENGAGKSTLIKILSGTVRQDEGILQIDGSEVFLDSASAAFAAGIATAFQELTLVPTLSVGANLLLGREPSRARVIRSGQAARAVHEMLRDWDAGDIPPDARVSSLPLSTRQRIELVRTFSRRGKVLLLDEPTSALGAEGVEWFFTQVRKAQADGAAVVFVSHRIEEIERIADRLTVLRAGQTVETLPLSDLDREQLLATMGHSTAKVAARTRQPVADRTGPPALEVTGLRNGLDLHGVDLQVRRGEIVGVSGLEGHGQRSLFMALFGIGRRTGSVAVDGVPRRIRNPRDAIRHGLGISLVPEDRQTEGVLNGFSGVANTTLPSLGRFSRLGFISSRRERAATRRVFEQLNISTTALGQDIAALSGGNQQKIIMAKWVMADADIILLYDPTRGIDVATKDEIYTLVRALAAEGKAVLWYSTDVDEVLDVCDRCLVMYRGAIRDDVRGERFNKRTILTAMFGQPPGRNQELEHTA